MKLNLAVALAAVAVLFTVQAHPAAPEDAVADAQAAARPTCCKYHTSCGPLRCCVANYCLRRGGPADCGYSNCCIKWRCY